MTRTAPDLRRILGGEARVAPRRSLAEEAADVLRELILVETLAPGTPVPERDLAEGLGISRTPMKEALRMLEVEGLVDYGPTRRPRVAHPTVAELAASLAVLAALEGLAGELACDRAEAAEIAAVAGLAAEMRRISDADSPLEFFRLDMEFHLAIVAAARNAPLVETHRQYNARLWRARFISSRLRTGRDITLCQHDGIVQALTARDPGRTRRAMREHLETAVVNIRQSRSEQAGGEEA